MRKFLLPIIFMTLSAACSRTPERLATETVSCADTTEYVAMAMNLELPAGTDGASKAIRQNLLDVAAVQLYTLNSEMESADAPKGLDKSGIKDMFQSTLGIVDSLSKGDYNEGRPGWEYTIDIQKTADTLSYVVFSSSNYVYMGGAHGGVTGAGYLTFDKKNGKLFTDFLKPECTEELQPAIRKGLCEYFSEGGEEVTDANLNDMLFEQDGPIPLPQYSPFPTGSGLTFVYQQYEIACYAAGMPAFTIPYKDLEPYLTDSAKELLCQ